MCLVVAALGASCIDLGGAEQQLCQDRPGLCPNSPPAPKDLQIYGLPEECRTVQLDVGGWTTAEPGWVEYHWYACEGDSELAPCVPLGSDVSQPYLTLTSSEVGKYLRGQVVTQSGDRSFTFARTAGPVERAGLFGRETLSFTGFETWSMVASNVIPYGEVTFRGPSSDAHWGTTTLEVRGGSAGRAVMPIPGGEPRAALRFAFRAMATLPANAVIAQVPLRAGGVDSGAVEVWAVGNRLELGIRTAEAENRAAAGIQLVAGAWFEVELAIDATGNGTVAVQWEVAGAVQQTVQVGASSSYQLPLLELGGGAQQTSDVLQFDDVVMGQAYDGFPMGDMRVEPLRVDGAGNHSNPGTLAWTDDNAGNYVSFPVPDLSTWELVDDWPVRDGSEADGVLQYVSDPSSFVEYTLGDLSATSRALSVRGVFAVRGAKGTALSMTGVLYDGTHLAEVFRHDPTTVPIETTVSFRDRTFSRGLDLSSGWSTCGVNGLRARYGYSSDATNMPMLDAVMAEALVLPF